ncbi:MAG: hypothetical protein ACE5G5_14135, partial [Candidatus Methylomirabilales bacterium]
STTETQIAHNQLDQVRAFYVADAGTQVALHRIKLNTLADPAYYADPTNLVGGSAAFETGNYAYTLVNLGLDPAGNPVIRVTSTGMVDAARSTVSARIQAAYNSWFGDAAHAKEKLVLKGNVRTDSYSSITSPDASVCTGGACPGTTGGVSTDETAANVMKLTGKVWVGGDALVGPGGNPAAAIEQGSTVTIQGSKGTEAEVLTMPCLTLPSGVSSSGNLTLNNESLVWGTPGTTTILAFDGVEINGNSSVQVQGTVILYVLGGFGLSGNTAVNPGGIPNHLEIRFLSQDGPFRVEGNTLFSGVAYGCNLTIEAKGNAEVFGSLVGEEVTLGGNARVHYDEALAARTDIFVGYRLAAWREIIPK